MKTHLNLGPLLFLVHLNDLPLVCKNSSLGMYADDSTITVSHSDINIIETKLSNDLNRLEEWCKESKMVVNANKTHAMLITTKQKRAHLGKATLNLKVNGATLKLEITHN